MSDRYDNEELETPNDHDTGEHYPHGPGRRLREARQARGLSVEQVAGSLHLQSRQIERIEADDYANLPPGAFVRGYVRGYARLLGLSEVEIVGAVPVNDSNPTPVAADVREHTRARSTDLPMRLITWLFVILMVVMGVLWWNSQRQQSHEVVADGSVMAPPVNESVPAVSESAAPPDVTPSTFEPAAPEGDGADAVSQGQPEAEPESQPELSAPEPVSEPSDEGGIEPAPQPAAEAPPAEQPKAEVPRTDHVTMTFTRDCWTEVSDSTGKRLIYDLVAKGKTLELEGKAPFKVFLGYAPGVTVTVNGHPFDQKPFQNRQMARFEISAEAAAGAQ